MTGKEEFLHTLISQIRCVKARENIARELEDHIEDQTEVLEEYGLEHEAAVREAVRRMGDPVEIGTQLDLIHRPQTDWRMLLLIALCSVGGLVIQYAVGILSEEPGALLRQILYMILGFGIMLGIYFLDYGFIGIWAKELFLLMSAAAVPAILFFTPQINGMHRGAILPMYLFVPVYAGVLYRYRGKGFGGIIRAILWIFLPVGISWQCIPSLPTAFNLALICGAMVLAAVLKGWFAVARKKMAALLLGVGVVLPIGFGVFSYFFLMMEYQKHRIQAFLDPSWDPNGAGYVNGRIRELLFSDNLGLFAGISGESSDFLSGFVSIDRGYGLIQLVLSYGLLFGIAVVIALLALIWMAFRTSLRQKNQLGFIISFGCGMIFLVMCLEGIGVNFALLPSTTVVLPFLTSGGMAVVVYDILLGLILSIHRYQNVLGEVRQDRRWRKRRHLRIRLEMESE